MNLTRCRGIGCIAEIGWITTKAGKTMPVDPEEREEWIDVDAASSAQLRITLITREGQMFTGQRSTVLAPASTSVKGYVPHWSTCPAHLQFRTSVRRSTPVV